MHVYLWLFTKCHVSGEGVFPSLPFEALRVISSTRYPTTWLCTHLMPSLRNFSLLIAFVIFNHRSVSQGANLPHREFSRHYLPSHLTEDSLSIWYKRNDEGCPAITTAAMLTKTSTLCSFDGSGKLPEMKNPFESSGRSVCICATEISRKQTLVVLCSNCRVWSPFWGWRW